MDEDDVEVECEDNNGGLIYRPYRANRYIQEYFSNQDKLTEFLFDKNVISYKLIADTLNLTETVTRNAITKRTVSPKLEVRRLIHMFFNKDYYEELGKFATLCAKCARRKCKQNYDAQVECKNYMTKKQKELKIVMIN